MHQQWGCLRDPVLSQNAPRWEESLVEVFCRQAGVAAVAVVAAVVSLLRLGWSLMLRQHVAGMGLQPLQYGDEEAKI